jgi:hypothetical protein
MFRLVTNGNSNLLVLYLDPGFLKTAFIFGTYFLVGHLMLNGFILLPFSTITDPGAIVAKE